MELEISSEQTRSSSRGWPKANKTRLSPDNSAWKVFGTKPRGSQGHSKHMVV